MSDIFDIGILNSSIQDKIEGAVVNKKYRHLEFDGLAGAKRLAIAPSIRISA
jgi:hypothetical protein